MSGSELRTSSDCFPATLWTQIIEVIQGEDDTAAQRALAEFCALYRPAVYNFFRRRGRSHAEAEDMTQAFFASRILEHWNDRKGFLHIAERRGEGKFRCFLSHVLWRFLCDEYKKQANLKSGGGAVHVPLEDADLTGKCTDEKAFESFGREFDRVFALEIIRKAAGRSCHSKHLMAHLRGEISQAECALQLGLTENAFKQAYHRFRERLTADLLEEVKKSAGPDENAIRAEIEYLISLFVESA